MVSGYDRLLTGQDLTMQLAMCRILRQILGYLNCLWPLSWDSSSSIEPEI